MNLSKIKEIRTQLNISRKELAEAVGVSVAYIQQIESNKKNPSLATLKNIASALSIPLDEILLKNMIESYENNLSDFIINTLDTEKPYDDITDLEKRFVDNIFELYKRKEKIDNDFSHSMKLKELVDFYPKQLNIYKELLSKMSEYNAYLLSKSSMLEEDNNELRDNLKVLNSNMTKLINKLE